MSVFREFWDLFVRQYGGLRAAMVVLAVTISFSVLEVVNVGFLIPLLEAIESTDQENQHWISRAVASIYDGLGIPFEVWSIVLALGLLVGVISALKYLRVILVARMQQGFSVWMRTWLMTRLMNADLSFFHSESQGKLADTLTTQATRGAGGSKVIAEIGTNLTMISAFLVAAFIIAPILTAITLAILLLVSLGMQFLINRARTMAVARVKLENELQETGLENLSGILVIRSFLLEKIRETAFTKTAGEVAEKDYGLQKNLGQIAILHEIVLFGMMGGIVVIGISLLGLSIPPIVTLLFILYRLIPKIAGLNAQRQSILSTFASLHATKSVADRSANIQITTGDRPFSELRTAIEFKNINFSYNGEANILKDTSFIIESGKTTAFVGTSGAGKSTLVNLLLRYYDPINGEVTVDGVDLKELDLPSWRGSIGVVSQDVFLFSDTIANNIEFGWPGASREDIEEAASKAYAHEFIQALPDKYETQVGNRGWNLSGGERQRIALARAILKQPEILILDEATSSLDSVSEELIKRYMREIQGKATIVVVAHRMSTIQDADNIVVLQDGIVVEEGSWDGLLAGAGVFANFHKLQSTVDRD